MEEQKEHFGSDQTLRVLRGALSEPGLFVTYDHLAEHTFLTFCTIEN